MDFAVKNGSVEWRPLKVAGISVKLLRSDKESGASAALVRFAPRSTFPAHDHPAGEEVYVLEGQVRIGRHELSAGDYLYTPPGGNHGAMSEKGCVFLVTLPKPVVFLKES